jgi:hypothetical protein
MRIRFHSISALLLTGCVMLCLHALPADAQSAMTAAHTPLQRATMKASPKNAPPLHGAYRFERAHWVYVHLAGTPHQIGVEHGYLLTPEIEQTLAAVKLSNTHSTKRNWEFFRATAKNIYWPHIETEYRQELQGIADGLRAHGVNDIDVWDIVALNAFIETPEYYVPWLESQHGGSLPAPKAPGNCSAFVATGDWTADHKPVIAHNNWTDFLTGEHWNVIYDIAPAHGYRLLMDGVPGKLDSGDDFGVNAAGIAITETTITQFHGFDPNGVPEFVRARKAMQYAASIDDFERIMLDGNNGGYANDWLVADYAHNEVARLELGLKVHRLWRTKNGYYVGSNFASDPKLIAEETTFNPKDRASSMNARHVRWDELMAQYKGRIDTVLAEKFLADHYDAYTKREGADERTLCGHVDTSAHGVPEWDYPPYTPGGSVNAKTMDSAMAAKMSFLARTGRPCGEDFLAKPFLAKHSQFAWQAPLLGDMDGNPWAKFATGDHAGTGEAGGN